MRSFWISRAAILSLAVGLGCLSPAQGDVDWRTKGAVTPVKNQGSSAIGDVSWAFAATGAVEGAYAIKNGMLFSLSEQQLLDCAGISSGNPSCADPSCGQTPCGLNYSMTQGLCTEASYPYTGRAGACRAASCTPAVSLTGWTQVTPGDETALVAAIDQGPVAARIEIGDNGAPLPAYTNYRSGVFYAPAFDDTVHQWVLLVGYATDTTSGKPVYIAKNSLGTSWGEQGYILLSRGASDNVGVADHAFLPTGVARGGPYGGAGLPFTPAPCGAAAVPAVSGPGRAALAALLVAIALLLLGLRQRPN